MVNIILCPYCKKNIELTEALTHQIREQQKQMLDEQFQKKLAEVKKITEDSLKKELEEKYKFEEQDLKKQLEQKEKKLSDFRNQEMKLREEKRALEEEKKDLKLEVQRQIDEEKKKIEEKILKDEEEKHHLKDLEKEKIINDLKKALEDAQRKAQQGSQQLQGEVQELDLEQILKNAFPTDVIEPVEKGVKGADLRQTVKTLRGNLCGVILWESKRTKAWSDSWITKLKDDLRAEKANIPVIISSVLPGEADSGFGLIDGVWVCSFSLVIPLAEIIRQKLIEVAKERFLSQGKGEKADRLYSYITSHEFSQQVEAMVEVYKNMNGQILKERAAFEKLWKTREEQVKKLLLSTANVVGGIMGQVGSSSMPQIKGLELLELDSGKE